MSMNLQITNASWAFNAKTSTLTPTDFPISLHVEQGDADTVIINCGTKTLFNRSVTEIEPWLATQTNCLKKINASFERLSREQHKLNAALTREAATRIKNVFRTAQEAVVLPRGFRYTAFRENKGENFIISTLMYTSTKLQATQWVMKSALTAQFLGEQMQGSDEIVTEEAWAFQPNHDPDATASVDRIKPSDKLYTFRPDTTKTTDADKQAAYWLVGILSDMIEDILQNPPNRVYEYFLADGLLRKKDLTSFTDMGLIRLLSKDVLTGPEVLKARPSLWKKLLEKGYITAEQALKANPNQLAWLTIHSYIPVERALKIDPSIRKQLERANIVMDDAEVTFKDVDSLVNAVADGKITSQKAWSINEKVLKPLIESKLITPEDAYKLDPSILNWMLEHHYIGRNAATKLKPRVKQEMDRKGIDWEELEASRHIEGGDTMRKAQPRARKTRKNLSANHNSYKRKRMNASARPRWMDDDVGFDIPEDIDVDSYGWADLEDPSDEWEYVKSKEVYDPDGWSTTYTWFKNRVDGRHIFMLDDDEPDPDYADWECDSDEEAQEWFDSYGTDSEDFDSSRTNAALEDNIQYSNFNLKTTPQGTYVVLADSDRFGVQSIVFESYKREECVDWIKKHKTQKTDACNASLSDASQMKLVGQINAKLTQFMTSPEIGYEPSEVPALTAVECSSTDGRTRVEVRAELTYESLMNLCDALNPIVAKYDRYAYFEPVTSGIIDAVIDS